MKDKHLYITEDSKLIYQLRKDVTNGLIINKTKFNFVLILKFAFYFGLASFLYISLFFSENAILFIISYILLGLTLILLAFNFAHDFSHNTVFVNRKLNSFGFIAIYTLLGAHAEAWRERHVNSHHFAPNVDEYDTDLQITSLIRVHPDSEHKWFHKFQTIYAPVAYTSYSLYWIFIKDFVVYFRALFKEQKSITFHISFWVQKIIYLGYMLVVPLFLANQHVSVIIAGFIAMHLIQSLFLLFTFFMTHHVEGSEYPQTIDGIIQTSWVMNQIKSSNDMHPFSKISNFILGGFNNHIAHHIFPNIHHYYYPRLSVIIYKTLNENGIKPNETSYWGGIKSHLKHLHELSY